MTFSVERSGRNSGERGNYQFNNFFNFIREIFHRFIRERLNFNY